ncbi:N-acetyl-gamma-glutamyl-phosphate reductase [Bryobacter aggregatus]|uniref:N-acetyl-gamma-glutamyl-phosphate reductase n=1 Tax=Bryobacter aggregatus TaxID=360054 RepID=UPI0004E1779A|nr:N-acetyl-gamma-glutamyl-phosphate reductase [Bryobacter aggregatus]
MSSTKSLRAGIVGFRGYSGAELVQILHRHRHVEAVPLEHRTGADALPLSADTIAREKLDVVLLATPPEASMELAPTFLAGGAKVVDLSGAFRFKSVADYTRWYKEPHHAESLLAEAAYGLPEFYRNTIRPARFVSNPGCYPTAANLALRPLVQAGAIDLQAGVICDAKSGVSGAGRKASLKTSFCEVTENFSAYSLLDHRHVPEVLQNSGLLESQFSFTAQLIPIDRGILETIYFRRSTPDFTPDHLYQLYKDAYAGERFIRIHAPGKVPDLHAVRRSNYCDIGFSQQPDGRTVVVAAIDNLVKGAAGQAIQNMNLILGLEEAEGL